MNLVNLLGVAFVVLKLYRVINWSWWWVLSPFLFEFAVIAGLVALQVWMARKRDRLDRAILDRLARGEAERKRIARERRVGVQV